MILTLAGILVKMIGAFYKVPLSYLLGDEGMGYFNASYTIYAWLYMLSTAGIPVALSILIGEYRGTGDMHTVRRVFRISSRALVLIGLTATALMMLGAGPIARLLGSANARYAILAIAPTLFFISVSALFRGLFQGYGNMVPTAVSQLIEAVGKVGFGVAFAYLAIQHEYPSHIVAAFAVLGVTLGTALCSGYLAIRYLYARTHEMRDKGEVQMRGSSHRHSLGYRIFAIAVPVTISASVMSLTGLIDLGMMIHRLVAHGYTTAEATALYGNYTTLVIPVFNLPSVLTSSIATGIVPAMSHAYASGEREEYRSILSGAFRTVGMIAVPCAVGLTVFARPVLSLLYPAASVASAYRLLTILAPAVVFLCFLTPVNAVLQACGSPKSPMLIMLAGGVVKVVLGYFLIARMGMIGAPVGTLACYFIALLLGCVAIGRRTGYLPSATESFLKPLAASFVSVGLSALLYYRVPFMTAHRTGILISIGVAVILYGITAYMIGVYGKEDLHLLLKKRKNKQENRQE